MICAMHKAAAAIPPTTTLRLKGALNARIHAAAARTGQTPQGFIVDALTRAVEQVAASGTFSAQANERWTRICATGKTVDWDDARRYLIGRAQGEVPAPARPRAKSSPR